MGRSATRRPGQLGPSHRRARPDVDASQIGPVFGWKGRYGDRGALRASIVRFLSATAPDWASAATLTEHVLLELDIKLPADRIARADWGRNSLRSALTALVRDEVLETKRDLVGHRVLNVRWRLSQAQQRSLASLH